MENERPSRRAPARGARRGGGAGEAALWLGAYLFVVAAPLFALLPGHAPAGRGFAWDFAMALGYAGLAMLGVQFALTARLRRATAPFGIDIVYYFHRYVAVFALLIVAAHYVLLRVGSPAALGTADPFAAPAHMTAGRASLLLFAAIVIMALARKALRLEYESWRVSHAVLASAAYALALWHLLGASGHLDAGWKRALWVAYGGFWLALLGYVRIVRPIGVARRPWRVAEVRRERGRVWTLGLEPSAAASALRFRPGQFAWVSIGASPFAMREHPFSIASSAERPDRVELSIKELGDFTSTIGRVPVGQAVWLEAPYGTFGVDSRPGAPGCVLVAGGIGVAPMMSMLRTLADRGDRRPLLLFYGNRDWERVAFREELDALRGRLDLRVVHVLLEPPAGWTGERGTVTREVLERHLPAARGELEFFLCGPTPMISSVERSLASLGVPAARVHSEMFEWV